jgi:hypothetical protein
MIYKRNMEQWPGEEKFVKSISQVKASIGPLSGSKVQEIALVAFEDLKVGHISFFFFMSSYFFLYFPLVGLSHLYVSIYERTHLFYFHIFLTPILNWLNN